MKNQNSLKGAAGRGGIVEREVMISLRIGVGCESTFVVGGACFLLTVLTERKYIKASACLEVLYRINYAPPENSASRRPFRFY